MTIVPLDFWRLGELFPVPRIPAVAENWLLEGRGKFRVLTGAAGLMLPANTINVAVLNQGKSPLVIYRELKGKQFPFFKGAVFLVALYLVSSWLNLA